MGCKFCATGSMGFKNNLSSGEIVEQLVHASRLSQIRNVVFMVSNPPSPIAISEPLYWSKMRFEIESKFLIFCYVTRAWGNH
jgi:hypothetical protein